MFAKFFSLGATLLALICVLGTPGRLYAQHGRGVVRTGMMGMDSRARFGMDPRFTNPMLNQSTLNLDRQILDRRLGGVSPAFDRRLMDLRMSGVNPRLDRRVIDPSLNGVNPILDRRLMDLFIRGF